jgi:hypothetical protein
MKKTTRWAWRFKTCPRVVEGRFNLKHCKMKQEINIKKMNELNSETGKKTVKSPIPVSISLQEAEDLLIRCFKDKESLIKAGLDWNIVNDLPERIKTLRINQAIWNSEFKDFREIQAEWGVAFLEGKRICDVLIHYLYYALKNNKSEYSRVKRISKRTSRANLIQNLIDLGKIGQKYKIELINIGLDLSLLDKAEANSFELARLLAKVNTALMETSPKIELRNKAEAHLKKAVTEIRQVGQFVFWKNDERLKGYTSDYVRKKNDAYRKKVANPEIESIKKKNTL